MGNRLISTQNERGIPVRDMAQCTRYFKNNTSAGSALTPGHLSGRSLPVRLPSIPWSLGVLEVYYSSLERPFEIMYRGTSLIRKRLPLAPYRRPMPRNLGGSRGVGVFLWAGYRGCSKLRPHTAIGSYGRSIPKSIRPF